MKQVLILLLFFLITGTSKSQPVPNGNILNPTLGKFEGTWQWVNGTDTVRIVLRKENMLLPFPENSRADFILGFHLYKRGSVIVESSLNYVNTTHSAKRFTILGGNRQVTDTLYCTFRDISKNNKSCDLRLELNPAQNELKWILKNSEGVKIGPFDYDFTLPRSLVLRKL